MAFWKAVCLLSLASLVAGGLAKSEEQQGDQEILPAALAEDDSCRADNAHGKDCDLSLRQLRGDLSLLSEGANIGSIHRSLQSGEDLLLPNSSLETDGDMDQTFQMEGSCKEYGCNAPFVKQNSCQCNSKCTGHGNCCHDFAQKCGVPIPSAPGHVAGQQDLRASLTF